MSNQEARLFFTLIQTIPERYNETRLALAEIILTAQPMTLDFIHSYKIAEVIKQLAMHGKTNTIQYFLIKFKFLEGLSNTVSVNSLNFLALIRKQSKYF